MALNPQYTQGAGGLYPASSTTKLPAPAGYNAIESVPGAMSVGVNAEKQLVTPNQSSVSGDGNFYPTTMTTAAIIAAANEALAAGGGTVVLQPGHWAMTGPLPLLNGVIYRGAAPLQIVSAPGISDVGPTYVGAGGVWLEGDGTFNIFEGTAEDLTPATCRYHYFRDIITYSVRGAGIIDVGVARGTFFFLFA